MRCHTVRQHVSIAHRERPWSPARMLAIDVSGLTRQAASVLEMSVVKAADSEKLALHRTMCTRSAADSERHATRMFIEGQWTGRSQLALLEQGSHTHRVLCAYVDDQSYDLCIDDMSTDHRPPSVRCQMSGIAGKTRSAEAADAAALIH